MSTNFEEVSVKLRSCVVACKGGIDIGDLEDDYALLYGEKIPFKQFGFLTLIEFLKNVDGLTMQHFGSVIKVVATANSPTTGHLELTDGQKSYSKKSKIKSVNSRSGVYQPASQPAKPYSLPTLYSNDYRSINSYDNYNQSQIAASEQYFRPANQNSEVRANQNEKPQPNPIMPLQQSFVQQTERDSPETVHDPVTRLNFFALTHDLPKPEFKIMYSSEETPSGKYIRGYFATVEINSEKFFSYPQEANDANEAKWIAAEVALEALENQDLPFDNLASLEKDDYRPDLAKKDQNNYLTELAVIAAMRVLAAEMNSHYNACSNYIVANGIFPGGFYVYYESGCWHRVRCDSFDIYSNTASVFFLDHGYNEIVNATQLCIP